MPTRRDRVFAAVTALTVLCTAAAGAVHAQSVHEQAHASGVKRGKLGVAAHAEGRYDEAEQHWLAALAEFADAGDVVQQANTLRNLTFLPRLSREDKLALLDEALALISGAGDPHVEGLVRHAIADFEWALGDFAAASHNLDLAVSLLERDERSRVPLGRALTSRARLNRNLNYVDDALADQVRAASVLESLGDLLGASQARHGAGLTHLVDGQFDRAVTELGHAVDLARRAQPPADARVAAALAQWAEALHRAGQTERALEAIVESDRLARPFESRDTIAASTARVLLDLGQAEEALARVERALANARTVVAPDLVSWLSVKADALDRLGRPGEALEASSRAVEQFERVRARLVPEDAAKRGFAEVGRQTMAAHVRRLTVAGRVEEALEAGERARARAFLDLLATTDLRTSLPPALEPETAVVEDRRAGVIPATLEGPGGTPAVLDTLISVRRGAASRRTIPEPDIASVAVVDPPTLHTVRSQAARLRSYLVSYWVAASETFIWLVDPEGAVTFVPVDIDHASLSGLVERTLPDAGAPTRSQTWRSAGFGPVSAGRRSASDEPRLVFGREAERANRELYRLLVAPVRNLIPEGSLVTLVPHGPLFRLAFAALTAPSGRYLIEDYVLHYAPSAGALAFTHGRRARPGGPTVVIADPDTGASFDAGEPLPRLPGAALEGHRIAAITGADSTRLLTGSRATEREVRAAATVARVLHIATHGIIRDDRPFDSFLALAGQGDAADDDGRLTMGEVYGLQLQAELVVLSACRTATGPVSGDGIIGLTRGFFAAGAPSVIASLWDLPDSVTASIFPVFYRTWSSPASRAEALREAQLAMIRELRAGRVTMETPVGRFTLPDHPSLWAGLILIGEP